MTEQAWTREMAERPTGYEGPNLSPVGLRLRPRRFGDGVYGLMATIPLKDYSGLGRRPDAAVVVDAGITPSESTMIRAAAGKLADRPVRYLITQHTVHLPPLPRGRSGPRSVRELQALPVAAPMEGEMPDRRSYGLRALIRSKRAL